MSRNVTTSIIPISSAEINSPESLLQYIKNNSIGDRALSIIGLAELCGVKDTSIIRGSAFASSKLAQTLAAHGFNASALSESGFNSISAWLVIEYFAYDSKAKALGAKRIARLFGAFGIQQVFELLNKPQPQKAPAKLINPNYLPDRKEAMDKLKEHGATGRVYGAVEAYNNALVGIENGCRHEVDELQAYKLGSNYGAVRRELSKRPVGFAKHPNHLAATAKQAMRYENYAIAGVDSVPEKLKPKKERKQLKAG